MRILPLFVFNLLKQDVFYEEKRTQNQNKKTINGS